jgi:hypothetical protein
MAGWIEAIVAKVARVSARFSKSLARRRLPSEPGERAPLSDLCSQWRHASPPIGIAKIFTEQMSGAVTDHPALHDVLEFARSGDTLIVWKLLYSGNPQLLHRRLFSFRLPMSGTRAA